MESELRRLQLKCLEILDIVDKICREHDILYSLCGGSVVGAHLYKGFLPWDDDIDIMMTREHYNKFLKVAKECLPEGFSIVNYQTSDLSTELNINFTKIINENTTLIQKDGTVLGVFIDIDVYDKVPDNWLKKIDLFLCRRLLTIDKGIQREKGFKTILKNIAIKNFLSDKRKFLCFFQKVAECLGKNPSKYTYRELFGAYHYYNMLPYRADIFESYTEIEFEGRSIMIVCNYLDYLHTRYDRTDFNEPKEKQMPCHYQYVNFDLPYEEYRKRKRG